MGITSWQIQLAFKKITNQFFHNINLCWGNTKIENNYKTCIKYVKKKKKKAPRSDLILRSNTHYVKTGGIF